MKKKLIAAILSLAMVASMVPATAFATDSQVDVKTTAAQTKAATTPVTVMTVTEKGTSYLDAATAFTASKITAVRNGIKRIPESGVTLTISGVKSGNSGNETNATQLGIGLTEAAAVTNKNTTLSKDITITKDMTNFYVAIGTDANATEVALEDFAFEIGDPTADKELKYLEEKFAQAIATPTWSMYPDLSAHLDIIENLSPALSDEVIEEAGGTTPSTPYANFTAAYTQAKEIDTNLVKLRSLINGIPTGTLTTAYQKDIDIIRTAYTDIDTDDLGDPYTMETALGKDDRGNSIDKKYNDADQVMLAVAAIKGVEDLTLDDDSWENFMTTNSAAINAANDEIKNAKVRGVESRIGNLSAYNDKIKLATSLEDLVDDADAAVIAAGKVADKADAPYTQEQVNALEDAIAKAGKAISAIPDGFATTEITGWATTVGTKTDKFTTGTANAKLKTIKDALDLEATIAPMIKMVEDMPKATDLKWTDKEAMLKIGVAYADLDTEEEAAFKATAAWTKLDSLQKALAIIESNNKQAAADRLTAQVNNLPTSLTLDNEDAVNATKVAYEEYVGSGYLAGTGVLGIVSSETKVKYNDAIRAMKTLTDAREKSDKEAIQTFTSLMTSINKKLNGTGIELSDKAYVKEARAEYDKLTDSQKKLVKNEYKDLEKAEKVIADKETAVDKDAVANEVIVAIRALPAADKLTTTDAEKVYAVNAQYLEAIKTEGVKALVTNSSTLFKAVGKVMDLEIAALPALKGDGTDTVEEIKAAAEKTAAVRATFEKIGADQQGNVTKKTDLAKAEAAVSAAKVAHTDANLTEIAKIDFEKELTAEQLTLIKHEKDCIAALTDAEIAKLNAENLKIFKEKALPALEASEEASISLENAKIEGLTDVVYNGKAHTPAIKVLGKDGKEIAAENYTVKYYSNKNVGQATVLVTAVKGGAYTGAVEATFIITPAKASITSLQVAKAKLRVNIKPMSGVNYRIAYKPTSAKSYKGQNTSLTSKGLPGIKAKTKYTVKVRAYIKEDGKTYFGAYSPIKHATTK